MKNPDISKYKFLRVANHPDTNVSLAIQTTKSVVGTELKISTKLQLLFVLGEYTYLVQQNKLGDNIYSKFKEGSPPLRFFREVVSMTDLADGFSYEKSLRLSVGVHNFSTSYENLAQKLRGLKL